VSEAAHTETVAEGHWSFGRRVVVEDVRRDDTFMRVTWHADSEVFVVSHWRSDVCIAATRVPVEAAPELVHLLVQGLAESSATASSPSSFSEAARRPTEFVERLQAALTRLRVLLGKKLRDDGVPPTAELERRRSA
jgi:hypothetical protein